MPWIGHISNLTFRLRIVPWATRSYQVPCLSDGKVSDMEKIMSPWQKSSEDFWWTVKGIVSLRITFLDRCHHWTKWKPHHFFLGHYDPPLKKMYYTVCPRSLDPIHIVTWRGYISQSTFITVHMYSCRQKCNRSNVGSIQIFTSFYIVEYFPKFPMKNLHIEYTFVS